MNREIHFNGQDMRGLAFSPAIHSGSTVYVSGQLPIDPRNGNIIGSNIKEQTRGALKNLHEILSKAGASPKSVAKVTVYITDIAYYDDISRLLSEFFGQYHPSCTIVTVAALRFGCLVEIEAIATV